LQSENFINSFFNSAGACRAAGIEVKYSSYHWRFFFIDVFGFSSVPLCENLLYSTCELNTLPGQQGLV